MIDSERRKQPRHDLQIEAKVATPYESIPVTLTNISIDGVQLRSPKAISSGNKVVVSLDLDKETLLSGEVSWILETYESGRIVYQIGVEIEAIVLPEIKAIALHNKAEMVSEILKRVAEGEKEQSS